MHQHPSSIVRLKIPASVKSKPKRPTEEPIAAIQHFFSNNNAYERTASQKEEAPRTPPTPNLDLIKLNRMRQATQSTQSNGNVNRLAMNKSLNEYEDADDDATTHYSSRVVCPSHPNKKVSKQLMQAKYFLASNTNVRFCTKCAVTMAEREPVLDEQSTTPCYVEFHKIKEIDKFRETVKIVKQEMVDKETAVSELSEQLEDEYGQALVELGQRFEELYSMLKAKHTEMTKTLQTKYASSKNNVKLYRQDLKNAVGAMDKYLYDVNRNYEDIVQDLSISHFDEIMSQYQAKIVDYMSRVNRQPDWQFTEEALPTRFMEVRQQLRRLSIEDRQVGCRSPMGMQRKENAMSHANYPHAKHTKSRTPDRLTR